MRACTRLARHSPHARRSHRHARTEKGLHASTQQFLLLGRVPAAQKWRHALGLRVRVLAPGPVTPRASERNVALRVHLPPTRPRREVRLRRTHARRRRARQIGAHRHCAPGARHPIQLLDRGVAGSEVRTQRHTASKTMPSLAQSSSLVTRSMRVSRESDVTPPACRTATRVRPSC